MDEKISQLNFNNPLTGNEVLPIVQSGTNRKLRVSDIAATSTVLSVNGHIGIVSLNYTDVNAVGVGTGISQLTNDVGYIIGNQPITLAGDATGTGTTSISVVLANSGISAGTYTKITVDAKGRATAGTTLIASDIPSLDWAKITTGKPTTLSGYGITDAQPLDGDLTSIAGLAGTSGYAKKTGANTWVLDTNTYITGNQTITLSGDISGSGVTTITTAIGSNKVLDTMIRQSAGLSILGRSIGTTGNVADITAVTSGHVLRYNGTSVGFGTITGLSLVLANGNGITWNTGTKAYDLGGTINADINLNDNSNSIHSFSLGATTPIADFNITTGIVSDTSLVNFEIGGGGAVFSFGTNSSFTTASSLSMSLSDMSIASNAPGFTGLRYDGDYSASFLDRSLVDRGYVKAAKAYVGKQTFAASSNLVGASINIPSGNFAGTIDGDIWYQNNSLKARINGVAVSLGGGTVTSVSGTSGRITSTGGASPILDIDSNYVGQSSITTLGAIHNGTWLADTIDVDHGGTGLSGLTGDSNYILGINNANTALEYKLISNGLTSSASNVKLGGALTGTTTITTGSNSFTIGTFNTTPTIFIAPTQAIFQSQGVAAGIYSSITLNSVGLLNLITINVSPNKVWGTSSDTTGVHLYYAPDASAITSTARNSIYVNSTGIDVLFNGSVKQRLTANGFYFGASTATAKIHLPAVTTVASTSPIKLTLGGTLMTTPENGAIEATDAHIYWTDSTGTRRQLDQQSIGGGITNSAANTELMMSNGTNAISSKVFVSTLGNLTLGDGVTAGDRIISVTSSTTNANLSLTPQGTGHVTIGGALFLSTALANDNLLTQVMVRDSSTGTVKYRLASTLGFTNAAANTELIGSDGTNGIASGIFNPSTSNLVLGSAGIAGNRQISAINTAGTSNLTLSAQGNILLDSNLINFGTSTSTGVAFQATGGTNVTVSFTSKGSGNFSWIDNGSTSAMTFIPLLGQLQIGNTTDNSAIYTANVGSSPLPNGGGVLIKGASGYSSGNGIGGSVTIQSGAKTGTGTSDGNIIINPLTGYVLLKNTTNASFSISGASTYAAMLVNDVSGSGINNAFWFHTSANQVVKLYTVNSGSNYAVSNLTTDRTYDANSTTLDEIADTLGTLISDLKLTGLIS